METIKFKISGDQHEMVATKDFDDCSVEAIIKPTIGSYDPVDDSVHLHIEIVSSMYYEIDYEHPIVLPDETVEEIKQAVHMYLKDNMEELGIDIYENL